MVVESDLINVDTEGGIYTPSTEQQGFLLKLGEITNVMEDMLKLEVMVMAIFWYYCNIYEDSAVEESQSRKVS